MMEQLTVERLSSPITPRLDAVRKMWVIGFAQSNDGSRVIKWADSLLGHYSREVSAETLSRALTKPITPEDKFAIEQSPTTMTAIDGIMGLLKEGIELRPEAEDVFRNDVKVGCMLVRFIRDAYHTAQALNKINK